MRCFVDSSAWIAAADRDDQFHRRAAEFLARSPSGLHYHTSNYVVSETLTRLQRTAGNRVAHAWGRELFVHEHVRIHYAEPALDSGALKLFRRYADQSLSFVDCTTIEWMRRLGIRDVMAFDDDFRRVGLQVVPGSGPGQR